MGKSVLDMSVSLDGFVAGPNETPENGLGDNGARLHWWAGLKEETGSLDTPEGVNGEVMGALMATGAVVAGRGTVEPAGWWDGDHRDGVAVFILSRTKTADDVAQWPLVTVLDDVSEAIGRAKRPPANATSSSTASVARPRRWRPECSTRSSSTWSPACSAKDAGCSKASTPPDATSPS